MDPKEATTYNAVLIAAFVIGVIIIYFIMSAIRQQKKYRQVQLAKIAAEINALERERERVAADLHDELGPTLSAVKFRLSSIEDLSREDIKTMHKAMDHIDQILKQVRKISNGLMPGKLAAQGPVYAIQHFVKNLESINDLSIAVEQADEIIFHKSQYIHVYRMLQEIIHNTVKHANAVRLVILVSSRNDMITIASADDGRGFNQALAVKDGHLGLHNLKSRVDILNGSIRIESKPGNGTKIFIEIPKLIKKSNYK